MRATIFRPNEHGHGELTLELGGEDRSNIEAEIRRFYELSDEQSIEPIRVLSTEGFTFDEMCSGADFENLLAWVKLEEEESEEDLRITLAYYASQYAGLPDADDFRSISDDAVENHLFTGPNNPDVYSYELCTRIGPFQDFDKRDWQFFNTVQWLEYEENSGRLTISNPNNGRTVWIFQN